MIAFDKGTYVLEYDIRINNSGEFSNGITTIQSMYAPEFASHTKGIRVKVQWKFQKINSKFQRMPEKTILKNPTDLKSVGFTF